MSKTLSQSDVKVLRETIQQSMACIRGEQPEDYTTEEAKQDTLSKLREAEALLYAPTNIYPSCSECKDTKFIDSAAIGKVPCPECNAGATYETERAALVKEVGDCCQGGDPMCAGGCLVEKALQKRAKADQQEAAQGVGDFVMVPRMMTDEMFSIALRIHDDDEKMHAVKLWDRLLAAAPQPESAGDAWELADMILKTGYSHKPNGDWGEAVRIIAEQITIRDARIRAEAVEECAKIADGYAVESANFDMAAEAETFCNLANRIRQLSKRGA